jgi:flagellar biosynthetic protein FliP
VVKVPAVRLKLLFFSSLFLLALCRSAYGADASFPGLRISLTGGKSPGDLAVSLQILLALTVLSLAPAIFMVLTSFTRIIIVLGFVRQALGTQQIPPTQVLISFGIFLTFATMYPVISRINDVACRPYLQKKLSRTQALGRAQGPIREFMFRQTRTRDINLFMRAAKLKSPRSKDEVPTSLLIPAFVMSEMKTGFEMGFALFISFLIVDMAVASILMSLGMMMIPPMSVSLPLKILLFVLADGWFLVAKSLIESVR